MANIKSQIKRNRTNELARLRNKAAKSEVKTRIKTAVSSAQVGSETALRGRSRWRCDASTRRRPVASSTRIRRRTGSPA